MTEHWKVIKSYPRYSVSDEGRVKNNETGAVLTPFLVGNKNEQYYAVDFYPVKNRKIHRLVAQAFIPNPDKKPVVNHIDGNRLNNAASNLEWVTQGENCEHAYRVLGRRRYFGKDNHRAKKIIRLDDGKIYRSLSEAVKDCGMRSHSHISQVLTHKRKTAGGYRWAYVNGGSNDDIS